MNPRKPRRPRWPARTDTLRLATLAATRLTADEIAEHLDPIKLCLARVKEGVATELEYVALLTALRIGQGIEDRGIVRGLSEHINLALDAMDTIYARATATGTWQRTELYWVELDAITAAIDLYEFQLAHVSAGELRDITQHLISQTLSSHGQYTRMPAEALGLAA